MPNKYLYISVLLLFLSCSDDTQPHHRNNLITDAIEQASPSVVGIIIKSKKK